MTNIIYFLAIIGILWLLGWVIRWSGKRFIAGFKHFCVGLRDSGLKAEIKLSFDRKPTLSFTKEDSFGTKLENPKLRLSKNKNGKQIKV